MYIRTGRVWQLCAGRIEKIDSLFNYAPGEGYSTFAHTAFQPVFLEDVLANMTTAQRSKAEQTCGDNKECLFDFAVTGGHAQNYMFKTHQILTGIIRVFDSLIQ